MAQAAEEMTHYVEYDYLVINDVFDEAVDALAAIVRAERLKLPRQQAKHGELLKSLFP